MKMLICIITGECQRKGEDHSSTFRNDVGGFQGTILADGLGSLSRSKETAKFIVDEMRRKLEGLKRLEDLDLPVLFSEVHDNLMTWTESGVEGLADSEEDTREFGATLIVTIETDKKFISAYVGNGSIWHIRGNAFLDHGNRILPWSMVNLLNPHTVPENGLEALYKYFSTSPNKAMVTPTVVEISKDELRGDILFSCTDGISSNDQISIGRVPSGVWANVDDALVVFLNHLRGYLGSNRSCVALEQLRNDYVKDLEEAIFVDDDASFGIILSLPNQE